MSNDGFTCNTFTTFTAARNHVTLGNWNFDDAHTFDQHKAECERVGRILWDVCGDIPDGEARDGDDVWHEVLSRAGYDPSDFGL